MRNGFCNVVHGMKRRIFIALAGLLIAVFSGAAGGYWALKMAQPPEKTGSFVQMATPVMRASYGAVPGGFNFVKASQASTPSVVFIKTIGTVQVSNPFSWFFDFDPFGSRGQVASSGSGVIVSADGYIVTNNHVIDRADKITVVLSNSKKEYAAKLVGRDPSTDLALLKIEASGLPAILFANSDDLLTGDWVVAVGNPFNLTSTVTAGIVSAKGRNINIVNNQFPIESFIQTDAAINPGNSGGALVNLDGNLVGINTAIASNTGSYAGYGFAIPSNIVAKIVKDLKEFGEVQRGFTGAEVTDISAGDQDKLGKEYSSGVKVESVTEDAPANKAGIESGDYIVSFNGQKILSRATYDELLAYRRPGDEVKLGVVHNGTYSEKTITLLNGEGNMALLKKGSVSSTVLGADFQPLNAAEKKKYGLSSGIKISNIRQGYIREMGLGEGFIITKYNNKSYTTPEDLIADMESARGRITVEGYDVNGIQRFYSFFGY